MITVSVAYHSGYGHTAALARAACEGAATCPFARVHLIDVSVMEDRDWALLDRSDAIMFGSPTYMGAVSGPFKTFMDQSSRIWSERGWQDKLAAGFTVSSSQAGDKFATLSQLATFAAQHGMLWVSLGLLPGNNSSTGSIEDINRIGGSLGAMAQANNDQGGDIAPPPSDRMTTHLLGARLAELTVRFKAGSDVVWIDAPAQPQATVGPAE